MGEALRLIWLIMTHESLTYELTRPALARLARPRPCNDLGSQWRKLGKPSGPMLVGMGALTGPQGQRHWFRLEHLTVSPGALDHGLPGHTLASD